MKVAKLKCDKREKELAKQIKENWLPDLYIDCEDVCDVCNICPFRTSTNDCLCELIRDDLYAFIDIIEKNS